MLNRETREWCTQGWDKISNMVWNVSRSPGDDVGERLGSEEATAVTRQSSDNRTLGSRPPDLWSYLRFYLRYFTLEQSWHLVLNAPRDALDILMLQP